MVNATRALLIFNHTDLLHGTRNGSVEKGGTMITDPAMTLHCEHYVIHHQLLW